MNRLMDTVAMLLAENLSDPTPCLLSLIHI